MKREEGTKPKRIFGIWREALILLIFLEMPSPKIWLCLGFYTDRGA
jgi:hypothetical protein